MAKIINNKLVDPGAVSMYFNEEIARKHGLLAAMLYSGIYYHTKFNEANENENVFIDGKYWMYLSRRAMSEKYYTFTSERQLQYALETLVKEGYILSKTDPNVARNNTLLYTLT